ncbi:type II toxin-antitoxin system HicA family toxin [Microbacterium halotolerans]|uniref:type II toxin-antitoxin system HicA family toxin n=1 Tax=Microbacterium halotolerans TaxID=246613 RepID=UPI001F0999FA|nr:type II toxin-antitoxin system HicA family toxin [Microbacterium halotolerans]
MFPSMKASKLQKLLERELGYWVDSTRGSHKKMKSNDYPTLTFSFHNGVEVPKGLVRKTLLKDVGLTEDEAARLLGIG